MSGAGNPTGTYTITLIPPVMSCTPALPQPGGCGGPFAGLPTTTLQTALATAQQALLALTSGAMPVTVSYAEGQGHRQVVYNRANSDDLRQVIKDLQMALGIYRRAAIGVQVGRRRCW
jgi:hypothetical protein